MGASLDQELVAPAVKGFKGFGAVDIVDENTAVGASIECNTKWLEALLTRGIP